MHEPLLILFVQIGLILVISRLAGVVFTRFKQPQVLGEMFAGLLLGPSFLGWIWPGAFAVIFPPNAGAGSQYLQILSQVAVTFFLFLVGLELDPRLIRRRDFTTATIALAGIVVPLLAGSLLTIYLFPRVFAHGSNAHLPTAALFIGVAVAMSAFPVLARILSERNLLRSRIGAIAITCAAASDLATWTLAALIVALARVDAGQITPLHAVLGCASFALVMFLIVKPLVNRLEGIYDRNGRLSQNVVSVVFVLILACAYAARLAGLHAILGALFLGCLMPKGTQFVRHLSEKLEDYTVIFLLPIFFCWIGLMTNIRLLNSGTILLDGAAIFLVAVLAKFCGTALTARMATTLSWRDASALGILMNTRGVMEMVVLYLGRELGIINDTVFAILVIMALLSTGLTTPLLNWIRPRTLARGTRQSSTVGQQAFSVLIPISLPKSGGPLVQLADMMIGERNQHGRLYALHLRHPADHAVYRSGLNEADGAQDQTMDPLLAQARARSLLVEPISFISTDIPGDIARVAASKQVDLVLMGFHKPIIGKTILGGTVHRVLTATQSDVAIFVDRGFRAALRILVPYLGSGHDRLALELASRMARNTEAQVTVLHVVPPFRAEGGRQLDARGAVDRVFSESGQKSPVVFRVVEDSSPVGVVLHQAQQFDLVVIGVAEEWGLESHLFGWRAERIARDCPSSLLIVRKYQPAKAPRPAETQMA